MANTYDSDVTPAKTEEPEEAPEEEPEEEPEPESYETIDPTLDTSSLPTAKKAIKGVNTKNLPQSKLSDKPAAKKE